MRLQLYAINTFTEPDPHLPTRIVSHLQSVDATTGVSTFVAELNGSGAGTIEGIDFRENGQLYGISRFGDLMTIDVTTGAVSFVGTPQGPDTPGRFNAVNTYLDVAFGLSDEPYIIGSNGAGDTWLLKLDANDGTIVTDVEISTVKAIGTIDFTAGGVLYGGFDELSTIDIATGVATQVIPGSGGVNNGPTLDIAADGVFRGTIMETGPGPHFRKQWRLASIDPATGKATPVPSGNTIPGDVVGLASTTVEVVAGDYDFDQDVDGADFLNWQRDDGTATGLSIWEANYGTNLLSVFNASASVPEPSVFVLEVLSLCCASSGRQLFRF